MTSPPFGVNSSSRTSVIATPPMKKKIVMVIAYRIAMRLWSVVVSHDVTRASMAEIIGPGRQRQVARQQGVSHFAPPSACFSGVEASERMYAVRLWISPSSSRPAKLGMIGS